MSRIDISCAATPYNPLPVIDAVFAQVASIRASSTTPIFVLVGENHNDQIETFLPYVAAHRAGMLGGTIIPPHLANLQFACERPHDTLKNDLADFLEYFPDRIKPHDSPSVQLAHILSEYGSADPQNAARNMFSAFARHNVPLMAVDASIKWGRKLPFLNSKDELTQRFMPAGEPGHHLGFMAGIPAAMHSRNQLMAHLLQQHAGGPNALTWLNCGHEHVFDNPEHAVTGLANLLQGHVIIAANAARVPASTPHIIIAFSQMADGADNLSATAKVLNCLKQAPAAPY